MDTNNPQTIETKGINIMQTDAIHTDVSGENGELGNEAATESMVLSPRDEVMQLVRDQIRERERAGQGSVVSDMPPDADDDFAEQAEPVSGVKVKIDGVEKVLPIDEVVKGYQKDSVASRRLAEAAEEKKRLEAWEQELRAREAALQSGASLSSDNGDVDSLIDAYNDAILEGDTVRQKELMKLLINSGRQQTTQPVIDEEAILAKVEARNENKQAWESFVASNPLFADESSKQRQYGDYLFNTIYQPLIESGEVNYREALMKTSADVNEVFAVTPEPSLRQQKEERKGRISNLPVAAGARIVYEQNVPLTIEQRIEKMNKDRGYIV